MHVVSRISIRFVPKSISCPLSFCPHMNFVLSQFIPVFISSLYGSCGIMCVLKLMDYAQSDLMMMMMKKNGPVVHTEDFFRYVE